MALSETSGSADKGAHVNPFVFVVGCPRSGTTLLQRMLDNHPQLTVANDTHFITRSVKRVLRRDPTPRLTPELVESVQSYRRFYRMGLDESDVASAARDCETYAGFVANLYSLRGLRKQKPLSGEKTPDYCRSMPLLLGLFPAAKFIHIIRDGRNTALSALNWATESKGPGRWSLWKTDPVGTCALWWRWQAGTGHHEGRRLAQDRFHQVRYEDLVDDPKKELRDMARFLGIAYSDTMANYHAGKTRTDPGLSAKSAWLPPVRNLRDWRQDMSPGDVAVFDAIAGPLLLENGYPAGAQPPKGEIERRVAHCLAWWKSEGKT